MTLGKGTTVLFYPERIDEGLESCISGLQVVEWLCVLDYFACAGRGGLGNLMIRPNHYPITRGSLLS